MMVTEAPSERCQEAPLAGESAVSAAGDRDELLHILLVEDDVVDTMAVQRAFKRSGLAHRIVHACDGLEALTMLRRGDCDPSSLVLLDLNMPRMGGIELLGHLRADPALTSVVVYVLTTSTDENDRRRANAYGVAGYIPKRSDGPDCPSVVELGRQHLHRVRHTMTP